MPRKTAGPPCGRCGPGRASMRPRPDAAENNDDRNALDRRTAASMRPRPDAAENGVSARCFAAGGTRFNEAAARCRGKPALRQRLDDRRPASMRPRPDAAENLRRVAAGRFRVRASMRPRPDAAENASDHATAMTQNARASMRPRPDAAENGDAYALGPYPEKASMRPRPDAAENVPAAIPFDE